MPEATVLPFVRPSHGYVPSTHTALFWSCSPDMWSGGAEKLISMARNAFEVSPQALRFLRACSGEIEQQELKLIQPSSALDAKTMLGIKEVECLALNAGFIHVEPLTVLSWAVMSYNPNFERGEINLGMEPIDGHYLVFVNRGPKCKPRLVLQPHTLNRKYQPFSRWIFATKPAH